MTITHCPTCGTAMEGRSICPRCGTLVGAELAIAHAAGRVKSMLDHQVARLRPTGPAQFLWVAAVIPVVLAPPLVSLAISVASMRRPQRAADPVNYEWIAIVSVLNIILSAIVLYKFHFAPAEVLAYALDLLRSWLGKVVHIIPGRTPQPSPRLVPI